MRPSQLILLALAIGFVTVMVAPEAEACQMDRVDLFTQADQATTIVVGTVIDGGIAVEETLKGTHREELQIPAWQHEIVSSCTPTAVPGQRRLLLLDERLGFVAQYQSSLELPLHDKSHAALAEHLAVASEVEDHLSVLVDFIAGDDLRLANDAARYLVNRVEYFPHLERAHRETITTALIAGEFYSFPLIMLAVRVGDRARVGPYLEALLRFLPNASRQQLGAEFSDATICGLSPPEEYPVAIADPHLPRGARALTMSRCELHVGRSLGDFLTYATSDLSQDAWFDLARACRDGQGLELSLEREPGEDLWLD